MQARQVMNEPKRSPLRVVYGLRRGASRKEGFTRGGRKIVHRIVPESSYTRYRGGNIRGGASL